MRLADYSKSIICITSGIIILIPDSYHESKNTLFLIMGLIFITAGILFFIYDTFFN